MTRYDQPFKHIELLWLLQRTVILGIGGLCFGIIQAQPQKLVNPAPQGCGAPVDVYKGVQSLWNDGDGADSCHLVAMSPNGEGPDGFEYQCVEFVRRFYRVAKGCDSANVSCDTAKWAGKGNAADYYGLASSFGLETHKNASDTNMPQPDDILSYSGGFVCSTKPTKYCGHVNIIKSIAQISANTWNVYVIEQNIKPATTQMPLSLTRNADQTYTLNDARFGKMNLAVQGWLRLPSPPAVWPMSGHDPQRTGLSTFVGPQIVPRGPAMIFDPGSPIVGDLTISAEGTLYFATSTGLYARNPDGSQYASTEAVSPVTGPTIDDRSGYVYIGQQGGSGWNLVRYTKQLQSPTIIYSGSVLPGPLIVGNSGNVYFFVGGTAVAQGASNWSAAVCGVLIGGPTIGQNGDVYGMCAGDGVYRVDGSTGASVAHSSYTTASYEPMIDSQGNLHSGFERIQFGGVIFVTTGDYSTWDSNLDLIAGGGDFTISRASLAPDGVSTVKIGDANYLGNNALSLRGVSSSWDLFAFTLPGSSAFTSIPTVDAAGKIFVGLDSGMICVNLSDHSTVWQFTMGEGIVTQPVIGSDGTVYAATSSGKIYSF